MQRVAGGSGSALRGEVAPAARMATAWAGAAAEQLPLSGGADVIIVEDAPAVALLEQSDEQDAEPEFEGEGEDADEDVLGGERERLPLAAMFGGSAQLRAHADGQATASRHSLPELSSRPQPTAHEASSSQENSAPPNNRHARAPTHMPQSHAAICDCSPVSCEFL